MVGLLSAMAFCSASGLLAEPLPWQRPNKGTFALEITHAMTSARDKPCG